MNPRSKILQSAVKDLKQSTTSPPGKRLIHVVVADSFSPEKKLIVLPIYIKGKLFPITLPIYRPVSSQVDHIKVYDAKGAKLADLSMVADIEAICLRQQEDIVSSFYVQFVSTIVGDYLSNLIVKAISGKEMSLAEQNQLAWKTRYSGAPDMRFWSTLPASIQAARFHVSKWLKSIKIVTYNANGKKLASKIVKLDTSSHNFVYARSIDNVLYAYSNKKLWLAN